MLEQRELDRVRGMAAALIDRATVECEPERGAPDAAAFAQCVALVAELETMLRRGARNLREHQGTSWAELGDALGMTRSGAQKRFGTVAHDRVER